MTTGDLDKIIYLQKQVETRQGGEMIQSYVDISDNDPATPTWAMIISQKGSEAFEQARNNSKSIIRVKVRYRDDIDTTCRAVWQDQNYNITEIDRSQRRGGYLWFTAEQKGAS